jgi:ubiquinone/menaquinone biosynthesis C-methylase UbiE
LQMAKEISSRFDSVLRPLGTTKDEFDLLSYKYDSWYESAKGRMYDRLEKKAIGQYIRPSAKGKKLLEVGCGTGHWSQFFSEYGFEVTGVDVSERMIDIAKSKNIPNASFQLADGHSLPFADETFDVTAAITTLEFVSDAEVVVREMTRCTRKPGGQLLVGVLNAMARLNRNRKRKPESPYAKARLFSPSQLKQLLEPFGRLDMVTTGFVPNQKLFLPLAPLLDTVGRFFHIPYGAFIAAEVKL